MSIFRLGRFKNSFFHGEIDNKFVIFISAFIVFLSLLFTTMIFSINSIFGNWQDNLSNSYTVQVLPYYKDAATGLNVLSKDDIDSRTQQLLGEMQKLKGINDFKVIEKDDSIANIKKVLGDDVDALDNIPMPVIVKITTSNYIDVSKDDIERVVSVVKGVKVFDNQSWIQQFVSFANMIKKISYIVISILLLTSMLIIFYFSKSFLHSQKKVITVAHIVGAHDTFIADAFAGRILILSFIGAFIGSMIAGGLLVALAFMFENIKNILMLNTSISPLGWFIIVFTPFTVVFLFYAVARRTVLKYLVKKT